MSLEVVIKQKLFGKKTMPLEVILGEELYYGNYENDCLNVGEMGAEEILVYNPERIGKFILPESYSMAPRFCASREVA